MKEKLANNCCPIKLLAQEKSFFPRLPMHLLNHLFLIKGA